MEHARRDPDPLRDGGDHQVLHVWGTHNEMGYAHGYLLAERVKALAEGYILPMFGMEAAEYEDMRWLMLTILEIPDPIYEEAEGIRNVMLRLAQDEANHKLRFEVEYDEHVLLEN